MLMLRPATHAMHMGRAAVCHGARLLNFNVNGHLGALAGNSGGFWGLLAMFFNGEAMHREYKTT